MRCKDAMKLLPGVGDVGPADGAVERHLAVCAQCREEAEALRGARAALRRELFTVDAAGLPSGAEVVRRIAAMERARPVRTPSFAWPPALAAAGLAAAVLAAVVFRPPGPEPMAGPAADAPAALLIVDDERTGRRVLVGAVEAPPEP
jgi:hypothetical protein